MQLQRRLPLVAVRPDDRLQYDIAGTLYNKDAGPRNQHLYLNGVRVAQMSDTQPLDLDSAPLGIARYVSGIADRFNRHINEFASHTPSVPTAGSRPPETT